MNKVHFPGLNGLRFFAALAVLTGHVELIKHFLGLPNYLDLFERINFGGIGVYFFFVLSGFLITYLLCVEKEEYKTISVKYFYLRRFLRIWPLYFLILILGFFILPHIDFFVLFPGQFKDHFSSDLIFYLLILPNVAFSLSPAVPHIGQSWSIGVEEQFYIFWPVLVKYFKNISRLIIFLLIAYLSIKAVVSAYPLFFVPGSTYQVFKKLIGMSKFECMLIGCFGAVLLFQKKEKWLKLIYHPVSQIFSLLVFPFLSYFAGKDNFVQDMIHLPLSVLFIIIILNISSNPKSLIRLDNKFLGYLGKISYGIYMYHLIVLFAITKLMLPFFEKHMVLSTLTVYVSSIFISCFISHLSYRFFEMYFIKKKSGYTKIVSG